MQTFTVKLYQAPADAEWMGKLDAHGRPMPPPKPQALTEFNVQGRNIDAARKAAKKKVTDNRGRRIRSLSCGTDDCIHVVVYHPEDAAADKP